MAKTVKIRCNGKEKHINEVDLEKAAKRDIVIRSTDQHTPGYPEKVVLRCRECTGDVIVTREIFEENL